MNKVQRSAGKMKKLMRFLTGAAQTVIMQRLMTHL
jgi:hypothetical protein